MTQILNYESYYAQGGDWGGAISTWLGYEHYKNCKGIHLNIMIVRDRNGPQDEAEKAWQKRFKNEQSLEEGYRTMQATKPQTLAFAMTDNPIGVAAWILEKFQASSMFEWQAQVSKDWQCRPEDCFQTKYERKSLEQKRKPSWFIFKK